MSILYRIKAFFYNSSLQSATKKSKSFPREMINIEVAKEIGIIYNATKSNDIIAVTKFAEKLRAQGKEVYILGFQDRKLKEEQDARLFDRNSINWYNVPNDAKVELFQKQDLDILICAFEDECLPLEYIAATSRAKFRVGAYSQSKIDCFELMININKKQELIYLLQQILYFLKVINDKH